MRKRSGVKEPLSKRAKASPATVPPTPDAPIPSPIHNDTEVERAGSQFGAMLETNTTTKASAKDVVQSDKVSGLSHGPMVDLAKGSPTSGLHWMKQHDNIVQLSNMQVDASNKLSSSMSVFIERTSVMKKVCIPCIPRVPWRILYEISGGALRETTLKNLNSVCSLRAPWGNSFPAVLLEDLVMGLTRQMSYMKDLG
jgi:hypothetical protein